MKSRRFRSCWTAGIFSAMVTIDTMDVKGAIADQIARQQRGLYFGGHRELIDPLLEQHQDSFQMLASRYGCG